jgi:hypothetical protein
MRPSSIYCKQWKPPPGMSPVFFASTRNTRLAQVYQRTGRPDLARRTAEEARDLVERIGLGALREDVEALLRELEVA